ncbi:MAG: hypothetical protein ACRDAS_02135, partial [Cetobacterium sp.]
MARNGNPKVKSISMYSNFMFEGSLARKMFSRSNMDFCLADLTSGSFENIYFKTFCRPLGQKDIQMVKYGLLYSHNMKEKNYLKR